MTAIYREPFGKVFEYAPLALNDVGFGVKSVDPNQGLIEASTGVSLRSWGEKIVIKISETQGGTSVEIVSKPKAQLVDWGKGSENINKFFAALTRRLSGSA
jgi:hypothetical protein